MSNLIKPHFYVTLDDKKLIDSPGFVGPDRHEENESESNGREEEMARITELKDQVLKDAEETAEQQVAAALQEAAEAREQARTEIEHWWEERRQQDHTVAEEARQLGYEDGVALGRQYAEQQMREEYRDQILEAQSILEQSYRMQRQIIQEAEPFLIELSCSIAEKIINRQLTVMPEWIIGLTQGILARKREKGVITLCVAPSQFQYIQDARDEFLLTIDSQAELQIVPDATVTDHGCVIRTDFGSVDARIDTQLGEIKQALQHLAFRSDISEAEGHA